jgi:hypothetical protein
MGLFKKKQEPRKVEWKEKCEHLFSFGLNDYYKFKSSGDIPLPRLERIQNHVMMLDKRLSNDEFDTLMDIIEGSIDNCINSASLESKITGLKNAMWGIQEVRSRKNDLMFHPDILCELGAYALIRQDENPFIIDDKIHNEKVNMFKTEGGTIPFLCQAGLNLYLPNSAELTNAVVKSWEQHKEIIQKASGAYSNILGEVKSYQAKQDLEKAS